MSNQIRFPGILFLLALASCHDSEIGFHRRIYIDTDNVALALEEYHLIKGEYPAGNWQEAVAPLIAWTTLTVDPYSFHPEDPVRYARVQPREEGRYTYDLVVYRPGTRFRTKKTFRILESTWSELPTRNRWFKQADLTLLEAKKCSFDEERSRVFCGASLGCLGSVVDESLRIDVSSTLLAVDASGTPVKLSREYQSFELERCRTSAIEIELDASAAPASSRLLVVGDATIRSGVYREAFYANNVIASWIE